MSAQLDMTVIKQEIEQETIDYLLILGQRRKQQFYGPHIKLCVAYF